MTTATIKSKAEVEAILAALPVDQRKQVEEMMVIAKQVESDNALRYEIEPGEFGDVTIFYRGKPLASIMKKWCLRNDADRVRNPGFHYNAWRHLGIIPNTLPGSVTMQKIIDTYAVARDEIIDMGDCHID